MTTESVNPVPTTHRHDTLDTPPVRRYGAGLATTALVLGIIALLSSITVIGGIVFGLLALVFGFLGLRRTKLGAPGKGRAVTGMVTGALGLVVSVVLVAAGFALWNSDSVQCVRNSDNQAQVQACADEVQNQVDNGN